MEDNSVNLIRVISLFWMINIHVAVWGMGVLHEHWWIANFWDSISRVSVPQFFMLSGALLLGRQERLGVFFRKRASKILAPLVSWSLIYLLDRYYVGGETQVRALDIFSGPAYFHLWFMYTLMGLYIAMPLLRAYYAGASPGLNVYVVSCWFVGFSLIPLLQSFGWFGSPAVSLLYLPKYAGYMLLGGMLKGLVPKRSALFAALAFAALAGLTMWLTQQASARGNALDERFYDYLSPNVVLMSAAAFVFLNWLGSRIGTRLSWLLNALSACSFGAYLVHMLILQALLLYAAKIIPAWDSPYIALSIPALTTVVFLLSLAGTFILRRFSVTRILFT